MIMNDKALYKINYGLYIVSSKKGGKFNGQVANTVFQVTSDPACIAVCINKKNLTHEYITDSRVFSVSILEKETPMVFIGKFGFKSGRDIDKFKDTKHKIGTTGAPIVLDYAIGYIEADILNSVDVNTHTVFIGKAAADEVINDKEPLTYDYYRQAKNGKSPSTAPTYVKPEIKTGDGGMEKYKCTVCSYIYDPEKGDPEANIKPGTKFEDLPDDWVCPVCKVGKDMFEKIK